MNERIKELAFLSIKNPHNPFSETGIVGDIHCFDDEELAKFVKLIIKECVSKMEWQKLSPKEVGAYNSALSLAQRNIKEHFGVQE